MKQKTAAKKRPLLNSKQLDFCKQYLIDFNATQSAVRAGYSSANADVTGPRMLGNVGIQAEINRLRRARDNRLEASADFVIRELMLLAKFDIKDAFDKDGSLKDIQSMPPEITKCISSVEIKDLFEGAGKDREQVGFTKTIRAWNKVQALELLGEHFDIFKRHAERDEGKEDKQKKQDFLQVIKMVAKDGQTTTITNRISGDPAESPVMDISRPRGLVIVGRTSRDSGGDSESNPGK